MMCALAVGLTCTFCASASAPNQELEELKRDFLSNAPQGWERLEEMTKFVNGSGMETISYRGVDAPRVLNEYTFAFSGDFGRISIRGSGGSGGYAEKAFALNSRYGFGVTRDSSSGPFVLGEMTKSPHQIRHAIDAMKQKYVQAPFLRSSLLFKYSSDKPDFRITQVTKLQTAAGESVQIGFKNDPSNPQQSNSSFEGFFTLNPQRHWAIQEYEFDTQQNTEVCFIHYGEPIDDRPTLRTVKTIFRGKGEKAGTEQEVQLDFRDYTYGELPESEFMLAAFGLPELDQPTPSRGGSASFWLLSLAITAGVIAVLLRRSARRLLA